LCIFHWWVLVSVLIVLWLLQFNTLTITHYFFVMYSVQKFKLLNLELDKGESSGITLALENEPSLLIIDEKKGRGIAKKLGIKITGILGVMIRAKEMGLINRIKPLIEKLERVDFRISGRLKNQILERVGE